MLNIIQLPKTIYSYFTATAAFVKDELYATAAKRHEKGSVRLGTMAAKSNNPVPETACVCDSYQMQPSFIKGKMSRLKGMMAALIQ